MQQVINSIYEIIKDYRNEDGIHISEGDIMEWGKKFGEDSEFVLSEILHLLKQTYFSKNDAKEILKKFVNDQYVQYGFKSFEEYLQATCFLRLQEYGKSQNVLIDMLDLLIVEKTGKHISDYDNHPKSLYVYLDDILATGGTIRKDILAWLEMNGNAEKIKKGEIKLELSLICAHTWGLKFLLYGLMQKYGNINIKCRFAYEIQNHLKLFNQELNIAIPVKDQPQEVLDYLDSLAAFKYEEYAFRDPSKPEKERFFTSTENRIRYENLILEKGLYIIKQIKNEVNPNIRPLGMINPNYKTFGLGTHFFTWRNVPNNCPLVFWWQVEGHNWKPLFPAKRR